MMFTEHQFFGSCNITHCFEQSYARISWMWMLKISLEEKNNFTFLQTTFWACFWKEKNSHQKSCFSNFFLNCQDISLFTTFSLLDKERKQNLFTLHLSKKSKRHNFFFSLIKVKAFSLFIPLTLSTHSCWSLPVLPIFRTKMKQLAQLRRNFPYILGKVALIVCNFILEPKIRRDS